MSASATSPSQEELSRLLRVTSAFHQLRTLIIDEVSARMAQILGHDWVDTCHSRLHLKSTYDCNDLYFIFKVIERWRSDLWPENPSGPLPQLEVLSDARNRWAHWDPLTESATEKIVESCRVLTEMLGQDWPDESLAPTQQSEIDDLIREVETYARMETTLERGWRAFIDNYFGSESQRKKLRDLSLKVRPEVGAITQSLETRKWLRSCASMTDEEWIEEGLRGWIISRDGTECLDRLRFVHGSLAVLLAQPGGLTGPETAMRTRMCSAITFSGDMTSTFQSVMTLRLIIQHFLGQLVSTESDTLSWYLRECQRAGDHGARNFRPTFAAVDSRHREIFEYLSMIHFGMSAKPSDMQMGELVIAKLQQLASADHVPFGEAVFWWLQKLGQGWGRIGPDDIATGNISRSWMTRAARSACTMFTEQVIAESANWEEGSSDFPRFVPVLRGLIDHLPRQIHGIRPD